MGKRRTAVTGGVLAELATLKGTPAPVLKARWRELFGAEPPPYNRSFLESRLAYRIQELTHGGLKRDTLERLRTMAQQYERGSAGRRRPATTENRPVTGTVLVRQWQGIAHRVTVTTDGFEYLGHPYKSLSAIAREIAGTRWNGWVFFGLKNQRGQL